MCGGESARIKGISTASLLNWEDAGKIPVIRIQSKHRRYDVDAILPQNGKESRKRWSMHQSVKS